MLTTELFGGGFRFLGYIRPSFVQYTLMSRLNLSSASSLTRFVLKVVRFSVMKILPGSPFRHFLGLYTFSRILYDRKRTITCDLPLWTVPMTYDLLIYSF